MDGKRNSRERRLTRCYQASRIEDEVWILAYEQVWPLLRTSLSGRQRSPTGVEQAVARETVAKARRA